MGTVIKARELPKFSGLEQSSLIVYCNRDPVIIDSAVSINVPLAECWKNFQRAPSSRTSM